MNDLVVYGADSVIERAKRIVLAGGDPHPCRNGSFCLPCCCSVADSQLAEEHGTGLPLGEALREVFITGVREHPSDKPLVDAMAKLRGISATTDTALTQEQALALLERAAVESRR